MELQNSLLSAFVPAQMFFCFFFNSQFPQMDLCCNFLTETNLPLSFGLTPETLMIEFQFFLLYETESRTKRLQCLHHQIKDVYSAHLSSFE